MNFGDTPREPPAPRPTSSHHALEQIRQAAVEALLALPRVGMGVGGFLLGIRRNRRLEILDSLEIACAHSRGPAFLLTPQELEHARRAQRFTSPLQVLGLYVSATRASQTRDAPELEPSQLELFDSLCPAPGQVALLVRPSSVDSVHAALFIRTAERQIDLLRQWNMDDPPGEIVIPDGVISEPAEPPVQTEILPNDDVAPPAPPLPSPHASEPAPVEQRKPAASAPPARFAPSPRASELPRKPEPRDGALRRSLYVAAILLLAAAAVLALRSYRPRPPELKLQVASENNSMIFRWNPAAVAGAGSGRLLINDSGRLSEFRLDAHALASGSFRYARKSETVIAKLVVGEREARIAFFGSGAAGSSPSSDSPSPRPNNRPAK